MIRSLEPLGEGDFCVAYRLNGHQVMRVPRHDEAARALRREACLLPAIAERLPVRVPVPTLVEGEPSCTVHELIEGAALTRARWRALAEPVRVELAHALGRFLSALHALDVAHGHACGLPVVDHRAEVTALRAKLREPASTPAQPSDAALPEALTADLVGCFDRYLAENASSAHPPALLHADVSLEHVLVDAGPHERPQISGIIDWGDACIGDPARDFIYLYEDWLYEDWGPALFDLALEAYEPRDPQAFCRRAYTHYLADQLAWTLRAADAQRPRDVDEGVAALRRAVARLARYA